MTIAREDGVRDGQDVLWVPALRRSQFGRRKYGVFRVVGC